MTINPFSLVIDSPIGRLGIRIDNDSVVTGLSFIDEKTPLLPPQTAFAKSLTQQLDSYFKNRDVALDFSIQPKGTSFQISVWQALCAIPTGETLSYGHIAKALKTSPRAVGNACRQNPIVLLIPCHRVVGTNGLGGFNGKTTPGHFLQIKEWLLNHEGSLPRALRGQKN